MERIIEILIFIASELTKKKQIDEVDLKMLLNKGYSRSEISVALSWIVEKLEDGKSTLFQNLHSGNKSFRYLHEAEKDLFSSDGWQELNQLYSLGILPLEVMETFIDRAMLIGLRNINAQQVRRFIAGLIFETNIHQNIFPPNNEDIIN